MRFYTADYFQAQSKSTFYPYVDVSKEREELNNEDSEQRNLILSHMGLSRFPSIMSRTLAITMSHCCCPSTRTRRTKVLEPLPYLYNRARPSCCKLTCIPFLMQNHCVVRAGVSSEIQSQAWTLYYER